MANASRARAEEQLQEKTAECESLKENLESQVQYGSELKRGILGYKEQKKQFQDKIRYLTKKLHGEEVDEGFELKKIVSLVEIGVQCDASGNAPNVHDAVFGKGTDDETIATAATATTTSTTPLSPKNAVEALPSHSPMNAGAEAVRSRVGSAAQNSPHDITAQCNQQ